MARKGHGSPIMRILANPRTEGKRTSERAHAPHHMDDRGPREIDMAMPYPKVRPELGQPPSTPDPIAKERIEQHKHKESVDKKGKEFPALGHRPSRDIVGRIHEDLLKEKDGEDADVIRRAREEKPFQAKEAPGFAEEREGGLGIQNRGPSQSANRPQ